VRRKCRHAAKPVTEPEVRADSIILNVDGSPMWTDRQDAQLILRLMLEDRLPQIWVASWENRDLRQLLWHRHRMVQVRTRIMNQLQAVALNEGLRCNKRLWREAGRAQLEALPLAPWASRRRLPRRNLKAQLTSGG
jgi:transposase